MDGNGRKRWVYHCRAQENGTTLPRGGATVLAERDGDGKFDVSVAVCSKADNFCRRTGLAIAEARLSSKRRGKHVRNVAEVSRLESLDEPMWAAYIGLVTVLTHGGRRVDAEWYDEHVARPLQDKIDERKAVASG